MATGPALELLGLRDELRRRMSESIAAWEIQPLHLSVFGSAARGEIAASRSVAAALAVLAGIAASDGACCAALGRRARGQDHRQALPVLGQVEGGRRASRNLGRCST